MRVTITCKMTSDQSKGDSEPESKSKEEPSRAFKGKTGAVVWWESFSNKVTKILYN